MPKWKDYTGFENEYIRVLGLSDESVQIERNKNNKYKAEYWDTECKRCGKIFVANKANIPILHSCGCFSDKRFENAEREVGKKYNHLTITRVDYERTIHNNNKYKHTYVFAICDCGSREKSYDLAAIKSGHTQSCGCSKKNNPNIMHDLTGQKFGRLTVKYRQDPDNWKGGNVHWYCECDCGDSTVTTGYNLEHEITKSCGCLVSEMISERNRVFSPKKNKVYLYKNNTSEIVENEYVIVSDEDGINSFLVDLEDYDFISRWYWRKEERRDRIKKGGYWVSNAKQKDIEAGYPTTLRLHQMIAERKYGKYDKNVYMPDHLSRNHDDNRRCNIVLKNNAENAKNRDLSINNTSGKTGVYYDKETKKWIANITVDYKTIYLGRFDDFDDAVVARKVAEKQYGFTCDNVFPEYDKKRVDKGAAYDVL